MRRILYYLAWIPAPKQMIHFGIIVTICLLVCPIVAQTSGTSGNKNVLVLYDEQNELPGLAILDRSIRSALTSESSVKIDVYSETLDLSRFQEEGYYQFLRDYFRQKYSHKKIDVVIAAMDPSLDFLLAYAEEISPGTPIVFCGVDRRVLESRSLGPNVTGVVVKREFKGTLDFALRLQPDTQRVVFIAGTSAFDKQLAEQALSEFREYEGRLVFTYLTDLSLNDLLREVSQLPPHTVILFSTLFRDGRGEAFVTHDVVSLISQKANRPVYGFVDQYLGRGIVGGHLYSIEAHGKEAAELVLRVLGGERVADIPIVERAGTVDMFDWRELRRWGISEKDLPPGSIVRFAVPSFWDEFKWRIIGAIALVLVQSALIAGLLISRAKRKRTNKELRESQERYGLATTAGSTGVWDWDLGTGEIYIDPLLKSILGYEDHEIRNHIDDWRRFLHPEDAQQVCEEAQAHIDGNTPFYEVEHRMLHKDGSIRWFLARGNVVRDNEGKGVRLVGTDSDITASKRADEALRQSESRNRAMLTALPDMIFMLSRDGIYLDYHARDPEELYAPPERFIGKNMRDILPQELARSFERCIEQTAQSNEPVLLDYSLQMGAEERYYESSMVKLDDDRVMCIARDITGRKRAEMRFRRYFELPLIGMAITSPDRRFIEVNQEICDMLGYSMDELTGTSWVDVTHPDDVAENVRLLEQTLSGKTEGYTMDKRFIHRDGHTVYSSISARCVRRADGAVDYLVLVLQGVTERKRAEEALRQTQLELAHVARVMTTGELAATIAHEVNQPLTAMVANANAAHRMLRNGNTNLAEAREAIDDIVKDAHRASQVLGRIRSLLRKDPHRTEPLAINDVIEEVVAIARNDLVGKRVLLRMELADGLPQVEADRVEIQQVMLNLMMNAVEAMREVEDGGRNLLMSTSINESGGVLVEVKDSGVGIAKENLERIFEAFYTTRKEGMGMGLSICRTIIEAHGGKLWAKSNGDGGATFRFTLHSLLGKHHE